MKKEYYLKYGKEMDEYWPRTYRNLEYVQEQCQLLAKQLLALVRDC